MQLRLRTITLAALFALVPACLSDHRGVRRLPQPQFVDVEMARKAALERNWELAASAWYEIYLRNDEHAPTACVEAARALAESGDKASARALLEQGLKQFPDHPELLEAQGDTLVRSGFRRAAESLYVRALEHSPERLSTMLALARVRVDLGLETAALPWLDKRIALGAGDAETWLLMARTRRAMGEYVAALEAYKRAFDLGERRTDRLLYAAALYPDLSESERALFDPAVVESWLRVALDIDPQSVAAHGMLGELLLARGDDEGAEQQFRRAVECDPAHLPSRRRLGRLLRKHGDLQGAAALAVEAKELEKDETKKLEWQAWIDEAAAAHPTQPAVDG